jgi:hypothetical protein
VIVVFDGLVVAVSVLFLDDGSGVMDFSVATSLKPTSNARPPLGSLWSNILSVNAVPRFTSVTLNFSSIGDCFTRLFDAPYLFVLEVFHGFGISVALLFLLGLVVILLELLVLSWAVVFLSFLFLLEFNDAFGIDDNIRVSFFWVCREEDFCLFAVNLDSNAAGIDDDKGVLSVKIFVFSCWFCCCCELLPLLLGENRSVKAIAIPPLVVFSITWSDLQLSSSMPAPSCDV